MNLNTVQTDIEQVSADYSKLIADLANLQADMTQQTAKVNWLGVITAAIALVKDVIPVVPQVKQLIVDLKAGNMTAVEQDLEILASDEPQLLADVEALITAIVA